MANIDYKKELVGAGLKQTKARQALLQILAREDRPLDVLELTDFLKKESVEVDQATVYRILDIFQKKGIISRFEFQEGKFRYEISGNDHHHLVCEACGKIQDISDCNIPDLEEDIFKKKGFKVSHHALEFYGLCSECQK